MLSPYISFYNIWCFGAESNWISIGLFSNLAKFNEFSLFSFLIGGNHAFFRNLSNLNGRIVLEKAYYVFKIQTMFMSAKKVTFAFS